MPEARGGAGASRSNMTSLLALKLLLLAFFILLTALSSPAIPKTRAVLDSVQSSFGGSLLLSDSDLGPSNGIASDSAEARLQVALNQLFQNMLPLVRHEETPEGAEMLLELSAGTFFGTGRTAFQPGRRLLLERLAVALSQAAAGDLDFELLLQHSAGRGAAASSLATERVATIAAELARQGVAPERLAVGLLPQDGRPNAAPRIRMVLRVVRSAVAAAKVPA